MNTGVRCVRKSLLAERASTLNEFGMHDGDLPRPVRRSY